MHDTTAFPGQSLGLPEKGPGSLATWHARIAALIVDWAASMIVATAVFGWDVLFGAGWRSWMILAVFWLESTVLGGLLGGSFGKLLARIGVVTIDGEAIGLGRATLRATLLCLVVPAVVVGAERRSLMDVLLGTVVVNRK